MITLQDYCVEKQWKFNQSTHTWLGVSFCQQTYMINTWLGVSFCLQTYMIKIILHRTDESKLDEQKYTKLVM